MKPYKKPSNLKFFPYLILGVLFTSILIVVLVGLPPKPYRFNTPENTWESYIRAINENEIEWYANVFFDRDTPTYQAVLDDEELIAEMLGMENVATMEFRYSTDIQYDWNVTRIAQAKIYYEIDDVPLSRELTVVFRFVEDRWYIYLPD